MNIGCCIGIEYYDQVRASGYESICLPCVQVAGWTDEMFEIAKKKISSGPLKLEALNSFCSPELKLTGKEFQMDALLSYTTKLISRAAALNVRYIGIGAPKSRNLQPGDQKETAILQLKDSLREICRIAAEKNIEILLESVCSVECNLITTTADALKLVQELDIPNLHLVYDIYHEYMELQPPQVALQAAKEIRVVHIAQDKDKGCRYYLDREHTEIYRSYWNALEDADWDGDVLIEAFYGDLKTDLTESYLILDEIRNGKEHYLI